MLSEIVNDMINKKLYFIAWNLANNNDTSQFRYFQTIIAFYIGKQHEGLRTSNELLLYSQILGQTYIDVIKRNLCFYALPLECTHTAIESHDPKWNFMNPSICLDHKQELAINVRAVNYKIVEGRYFINGLSPSATNPVVTKNFRTNILLSSITPFNPKDTSMLKYPGFHVEGLEDLRLFLFKEKIHFLATTRQLNPQGINQIVLGNEDTCVPLKIIGSKALQCEKNWLPVVMNNKLTIIYCLGPKLIVMEHISDGNCKIIIEQKLPVNTEGFRGSAGPVEINTNQYLVISHEVTVKDNQRHYYHRFLLFDKKFNLHKISLPFVMKGKQPIEYISGLAKLQNTLYITWGQNDAKAFISEIHLNKLLSFLTPIRDCQNGYQYNNQHQKQLKN